jgi:hypothetical protein
MRQIPMLTTVAQNQTALEWEFSDPHVVWYAPSLSTSEFREAFFTVWGLIKKSALKYVQNV